MDTAHAPGTASLTSARGPDEEWSPLTDGFGGFVDIETLSGGYGQAPRVETEHLYGDDLIGVSISRAQTQMRSPDTPVAEKARALNLPVEYFQRILALAEEPDQENDTDEANDSQPSTPHASPRPPTLCLDNAERSASPERIETRTLSRESTSASHQGRRLSHTLEGPDLPFDSSYASRASKAEDANQLARPFRECKFPPHPSRKPPTPPVDDQMAQQPQRSEDDGSRLTSIEEGAQSQHPHRLSITKNLLSGAGSERRRSLSSAPANLLSNLRKLLPDIPSGHFNRSSISLSLLPSSNGNSGQQSPSSGPMTPTSRQFRWSIREPPQRRSTGDATRGMQSEQERVHDLAALSRSQVDGNMESLLSPTSPASNASRARSNSEGSLYIRRRVSGVSAYDDISAFAHVSDMANSRFKAITDSFQNSTLKLPRLPALRQVAKRRTSPDQSSGEIPLGIDETSGDGGGQAYHSSSAKKIWNATKGVEVETPQQRAHPILSRALSKTTGDIVVLGGYRGSILRSAKPPHRQLWVPIKVGLNMRKVDLEVGLTREDEERMEQTIIPSGILSHIGPIDICRRLLKHMRKCPNTRENKLRVHDWGYDWRLSPDLLSGKLIKFLESLECNHPETPHEKRGATVIAHSLGGLITRHAVNQRPDLFAGVIYAGVPQHCVNILGPLRNGDDVLLSSRVLTAQVNFTLRTSYALLPEDGRCFIQKHTNKRYDLDFFDPRVWEEYRLSPCINPPIPHGLREKEDRRKSIIGALSDSISGSNKRGSWFGGQPSQGQSSNQTDTRVALEEANQRAMDKALEAGQDMEGNAEGMVGPSMKQSTHRPTVATTVTIPKDLAEEYLDRTLAEISVFKKQLNFIPAHQENNLYPPHAFIFGKTVPTVYGARVANKEAIKYTDVFDDLAFAAGDGVVLASAAQLPEGYRCVKGGRVESDRGHVGIMGDLEGVGRCLEAVVDGRAKGVGLGKAHARRARDSSDS
ncbi:uncharacterized protein Z519_11361 [Cladophialophora bantiana CBS 173.52]|uniref:AB hydrolase-1 domain-containing protein n=1 Tax=Cladophialophora bantiana (strain ATCC 10958 / CBS 173.52 / CDC B-1940 / NIH 8579) TaxID=1442370 RepID=A0A0D2HBD8_CLAB1|nr:uncharacterized protein Z519_11361 [Cladophialophora bantiana CBS 173.52]KIW88250.1 hypothetical protein Z519_11361 [Cladophialophora bantiana CBS 173.52]